MIIVGEKICLCGEGEGACPFYAKSTEGYTHPTCISWDGVVIVGETCEGVAIENIEKDASREPIWMCRYCAAKWHHDNDPFTEKDLVEVAIYETWQEWGGPEEGGWTFDCGRILDFIRIPWSEKSVADAKEWLQKKYGESKRHSHRESGIDIKTKRTSIGGWPAVKPHYE